MKEDHEKPLYADCKKQKGYGYFWSDPVISRERIYKFADRRLLVIGWILIIIAIGVIGWLNPFNRPYASEVPMILLICIVIAIIAEFFYTRKFVYRFGRFRVTWQNEEKHPNEEASSRCDKDGKFLKTEENLKAAKRSRRAFLVLFAGIIAAVLLYCFLWIGLSYLRVYSWHRGEIEDAKQIAQKYDHVYYDFGGCVGGRTESGEDISQQDRQRLWEIFHSLKWEYVSSMWVFNSPGHIEIGIDTIFGYSKLYWYDDITEVLLWAGYPSVTVIQLDEHWVYVRMDDGKGF